MKKILFTSLIFLCSVSTFAQTEIITTGYQSPYTIKGYDGYIDSLGHTIILTRGLNGTKIAKLDTNYNVLWAKEGDDLISQIDHEAGIVPLASGDFLAFIGRAGNSNHGHLIKFTTDGNILWDRVIDTTVSTSLIYDVIELSNSNILLSVTHYADAALICMDSNGNQIWTKVFEANELYHDMYGFKIMQTSDNKILMATGITNYGIGDIGKLYMTKLELNGNLIWEKYNGLISDRESVNAIIESSDNYFYTIGDIGEVNVGIDSTNIIVRKYDSSGVFVLAKEYGGTYWDGAYDILECPDGNFILSTMHRPEENCTPFLNALFKITPSLDTIWTKVLGSHTAGGAEFRYLKKKDSIIYTYGSARIWSHFALTDQALIKTDQDFDIPCEQYPHPLNVWNPDGINAVSPQVSTYSTSIPFYDENLWSNSSLWVADGCSGNIIDSLVYVSTSNFTNYPDLDFTVFPNPNKGEFYIEIPSDEFVNLKILNMSGQEMYSSIFQQSHYVNISEFGSAIYIIELSSNKRTLRKRVVVN